jgi:acetyltransferase-like isoleucine patch superfamily enzyme
MSETGDRTLAGKLALRAYLATMRIEGMWALGLRRRLVGIMTGHRLTNVNIFPDVFLEGVEGLRLGHDVSLNRGCNVSAFGGITIGNYVSIGHAVSIVSTNHGFADRDTPIQLQPSRYEPVAIADNVWIGARATILAGVAIPSGTIVAAGAVVTRSIADPDMIVAGVPARAIKPRFG